MATHTSERPVHAIVKHWTTSTEFGAAINETEELIHQPISSKLEYYQQSSNLSSRPACHIMLGIDGIGKQNKYIQQCSYWTFH